jgi:CheY-like chemotaxis protein
MLNMGVKILLADDSPTVHKVIKIILKDEPCEIVECARETDLVDKLNATQPAAVFLDFNFSESQTGYDLCRQIKKICPKAKILVMYGTFDTVDESALRDADASQHVVKPFDTAKFIIQVRNLIDGTAAPVAATSQSIEIDEGWSIRETVEKKSPDIGRMTEDTVSPLNDDLSDWGMMIPGVIGKSAGAPDLPPVIGEAPVAKPVAPVLPKAAPAKVAPVQVHNEVQLPSDDDLEYPDMGTSNDLEIDTTPVDSPKSKLIPLKELVTTEKENSLSLNDLAESTGMSADEEIAMRIADQIRDEVESDLWAADAFEETQPKLSVVKEQKSIEPQLSAQSEEFEESGVTFDDSLFEPLDKQDKLPHYNKATSATNFSGDLEALRPMLKDIVREVVAEYCRQGVDKVAWEVIPDLAENLIKKELQKLSDKVTKDL